MSQVVLDSDQNSVVSFAKILAGVFLVPWIAMLCAGALAHRQPQLFGVLAQPGYWDFVLLRLLFGGLIRSGQIGKYYLKTEKGKK